MHLVNRVNVRMNMKEDFPDSRNLAPSNMYEGTYYTKINDCKTSHEKVQLHDCMLLKIYIEICIPMYSTHDM